MPPKIIREYIHILLKLIHRRLKVKIKLIVMFSPLTISHLIGILLKISIIELKALSLKKKTPKDPVESTPSYWIRRKESASRASRKNALSPTVSSLLIWPTSKSSRSFSRTWETSNVKISWNHPAKFTNLQLRWRALIERQQDFPLLDILPSCSDIIIDGQHCRNQ